MREHLGRWSRCSRSKASGRSFMGVIAADAALKGKSLALSGRHTAAPGLDSGAACGKLHLLPNKAIALRGERRMRRARGWCVD